MAQHGFFGRDAANGAVGKTHEISIRTERSAAEMPPASAARNLPTLIVLLGPIAARAVHPTGVAATGKVGQWSLLGRIPTITLHHPMRLILAGKELADPLKRENWAALKALQARLRTP